jgi:lysophospholipase L1-like esterase
LNFAQRARLYPTMISVDKLRKNYASLAIATFNCIAAFVLLNLALGLMFFMRDRARSSPAADQRISAYREKFVDHAAYVRTPPAEVTALLDEQDAMGTIGFQYEPWVEFRNPQFSGRFLNTNEQGYRATRRASVRSGKPLKVYVFGGSTTFGYGVRDEDTIPSYLQKILEEKHPDTPVEVKNFGQGYYYSSQELLALLSVLKNGDVPDWVVFVDGGNDAAQLSLQHDEPMFTPTVRRLWQAHSTGLAPSGSGFFSQLPIGRLVQTVAARMSARAAGSHQATEVSQHMPLRSDEHLTAEEREKIVQYVVSRYLANLRITRTLCHEFGAKCLFVWQPHPSYKYDRTLHRTFPYEGAIPLFRTEISERMEHHQDPDFIFLGHLLENRKEKSYVDDVHYNEALNEEIAGWIARTLRTGGTL